jgi:drug/metabolite transporter (DMT)-like permease
VSGSVASLLTYLFGVPLLLLLVSRAAPRITADERGLLLALALAAGWTNLAYVLAVIHGEVMRVLLLFYLAPLWTVFFAARCWRNVGPGCLSGDRSVRRRRLCHVVQNPAACLCRPTTPNGWDCPPASALP